MNVNVKLETVIPATKINFQYIVQRKEQEKICFLSTTERGIDVLKKEKILTKPYNIETTSALYHVLNKIRSKRGVGGLANLTPRFEKMRLEQIPGPNQYDLIDKKIVKPNKKPFGSAPRICRIFSSQTPGPGSYQFGKKCRRTRMQYSFGGRTQMKPAVELKCMPKPLDMCEICQTTCTGDYWCKNDSTFLCLTCMRTERFANNKYSKRDLQNFKRIRNCGFMHNHEGTTAAIQLLSNYEILSRTRKENYLDLYFDKY